MLEQFLTFLITDLIAFFTSVGVLLYKSDSNLPCFSLYKTYSHNLCYQLTDFLAPDVRRFFDGPK